MNSQVIYRAKSSICKEYKLYQKKEKNGKKSYIMPEWTHKNFLASKIYGEKIYTTFSILSFRYTFIFITFLYGIFFIFIYSPRHRSNEKKKNITRTTTNDEPKKKKKFRTIFRWPWARKEKHKREKTKSHFAHRNIFTST